MRLLRGFRPRNGRGLGFEGSDLDELRTLMVVHYFLSSLLRTLALRGHAVQAGRYRLATGRTCPGSHALVKVNRRLLSRLLQRAHAPASRTSCPYRFDHSRGGRTGQPFPLLLRGAARDKTVASVRDARQYTHEFPPCSCPWT